MYLEFQKENRERLEKQQYLRRQYLTVFENLTRDIMPQIQGSLWLSSNTNKLKEIKPIDLYTSWQKWRNLDKGEILNAAQEKRHSTCKCATHNKANPWLLNKHFRSQKTMERYLLVLKGSNLQMVNSQICSQKMYSLKIKEK